MHTTEQRAEKGAITLGPFEDKKNTKKISEKVGKRRVVSVGVAGTGAHMES